MPELNPNHPVTTALREQWHKLCAIVVMKLWDEYHAGVDSWNAPRVEITSADIDRLINSGRANITMRVEVVPHLGEVITLELVTDAEAARLARDEGGLPV